MRVRVVGRRTPVADAHHSGTPLERNPQLRKRALPVMHLTTLRIYFLGRHPKPAIDRDLKTGHHTLASI
jgi:hypothetical protein